MEIGSGITIGGGISVAVPPPNTPSIEYLVVAGGGGGGGKGTAALSGAGGSGVVIIRHIAGVTATCSGNPSVTTAGGFTVYEFTSSGTMAF
jgi:hypothetical protein